MIYLFIKVFVLLLTLALGFFLTISQTKAASNLYYVSPNGNDSNSGTSETAAIKTIQKAIDLALPGGTIILGSGTYLQDFISKRSGSSSSPITIKGPSNAVVKGGGRDRVIEINHNYLNLEGFTVDGLYGSSNQASDYRDKLIFLLGKEPKKGVTGVKITNMDIKNAGGECIRLRYFATRNEISNNTISNCGAADFKFKAGGKNGEGVYIGTAPEQLKDGKNPTRDPDVSEENWIHHNDFNTQGNECVDIKEASKNNLVEYNKCTGQKDSESAGFNSRGNENIFRLNESFSNTGAGVRLGGDTSKDGIKNHVYNNKIYNNLGGGIKFQRFPQGEICGNTLSNNALGDSVGNYGSKFDPDKTCPDKILGASLSKVTCPTGEDRISVIKNKLQGAIDYLDSLH